MKIIKNPPTIVYKIYLHYCKVKGAFHSKPDFLIIGGEKCGTTSLYEYLIKHPDIMPAKGKEVAYFDYKFSNGFGWYKTFFPRFITKKFKEILSKNKILSGEATPRYLNHPNAPKRISNFLPNVKLIVLLRNPIDRAYSHYHMESANGREKLSFEESIEQENERINIEYEKMEKDENYYGRKYYWYSHREAGIYIKHLKRWMKFFPKNQFLIIKSEDLFENTTDTYNKVLEFLGLPYHELSNYKKFRERQYDEKLDPILRKKLSEFYLPYNEQLYEFLNENFDWEHQS
jgi:hypothetical protein